MLISRINKWKLGGGGENDVKAQVESEKKTGIHFEADFHTHPFGLN